MKKTIIRVLAALLVGVLTCGAISVSAVAYDWQPDFEFSPKTYTLPYRGQVQVTVTGETPVRYDCTENKSGISIDTKTGLVTSGRTFWRAGLVVVNAYDAEDRKASCVVEIKASWWQWLIVILLFGWVWY